MGWFVKLMFVVGVVLSFILIKFTFSDTIKAILISFVGGIIVFILYSLISGLRNYISLAGDRKKDKVVVERIWRRKRRDHVIGIILLVVSIVFFLNSYLYVKALMGNDMLVSLKVDKENFVLKNGEDAQFNVKARVLVNPFCKASCFLSLEDLSKGEVVYSEYIYLKVSSPLSKDYSVNSNDEKFGQTLYKVSIECNTIRDRFCYTAGNTSKSRTKIISMDYELNDFQKERKNILKNETENLSNELYSIRSSLNGFNYNFSFLDLSKFQNESKSLYNLSNPLVNEISNLSILYENQEYSELEANIIQIKENMSNIKEKFNQLNTSIMYDVDNYNILVDKLNSIYSEILYLENYNFSSSSLPFAKSFIEEFNLDIIKFGEHHEIGDKIILFNKLEFDKNNLLSMLKNDSDNNVLSENKINMFIDLVNISKILIQNETSIPNFILDEPSPICCLNKECYRCIDDSSSNYPIVFVHGHSFNEKISAESSAESFDGMAREFEKNGYIDAGYFYRSKYDEASKGYLGKINESIVLEATYYLDTLVTDEGSFILNSKWEDIDTYASRLNEIVSNVKYITGKDKVIIVAHSMGGLVTRRYIQKYGKESVDKLILVGTPNHGVDGFVLNYCPVFGADIECSEMDKNSFLLAVLNGDPLPDIPIYNLVGLGCSWESAEGDGIVKSQSAYLNGADNIYVTGTCNGVDFFHVNMIKPNRHPEIYSIIKDLVEKKEV
jgi:hypothetical protein